MKRKSRFVAIAVMGALISAGLLVSPASAATTTGTWYQYPKGAFEYQAEVQQPINSANTSNWSSKSKGGIPIMYRLSSRTGPAVFQSVFSDNPGNTANDYAYLALVPSPAITFADIETLSTKYSFSEGNCWGGSLRWEIGIDQPSGPDGQLFIYYGAAPNFTDCTTNNQSDVNMIGQPDLRYDTSQFDGVFYNSYANALALLGAGTVTYAELVIDSGWYNAPNGDQVLTVSDTTVNDNVHQWDAGGTGAFEPTCNLPDAFIDVTNVDPLATGTINETTVYPPSVTDAGDQFRVVDCKYQYVLSIPSMSDGKGTYDVEILIGGNEVATVPNPEVRFDLK